MSDHIVSYWTQFRRDKNEKDQHKTGSVANLSSLYRHIKFLLVHLLPQFAFHVTVFNLFFCFPWERVVYYQLET